MPVATRAVALQEAIKYSASADRLTVEDVLARAEAFHQFIMRDEAASVPPAQPVAAAAPKAEKPKAVKPRVTEDELAAKAMAEARAKAEAEQDAPSTEEITQVIEALLDANKKDEAVALFKYHGAKSLSSLPKDKYGEFVKAAKSLLAQKAAPATEPGLLD